MTLIAHPAEGGERLQIGPVDPAACEQARSELLHEQFPLRDAAGGIRAHQHRHRLRTDGVAGGGEASGSRLAYSGS